MAKKRQMARSRAAGTLGKRRHPLPVPESEVDAYLAAKDALRRIGRSAHVAALTCGAVTVNWRPAA